MWQKSWIRTIFLLTISSSSAMANNTTCAQDYVVGISPFIKQELKVNVEKQLLVIFFTVHVNRHVRVFNSYDNSLITQFRIPNNKAYYNLNLRAKYLAKHIMALKSFFKQQNNHDKPIPHLIHLPNFLQFVGQQLPNPNGLRILVVGNPLFVDEKNNLFSMTDGFFPSDGHLKKTQKFSPYGTAEKSHLLKNTLIFFDMLDSKFTNGAHENQVKRFWQLFVQHQGGFMHPISNNLEISAENYLRCERSRFQTIVLNETQHKAEMIAIRRVPDFMRINQTQFIAANHHQGNLKIGIKWNCLQCDLDLYAKATPTDKELSYRRVRSERGRYYKDFRQSPTPSNGLEYVEYNGIIDLHQTSVSVNFYGGASKQPVHGTLVVNFRGRNYYQTFVFKVHNGNRGKDKHRRTTSPYWIRMNLPRIVGLDKVRTKRYQVKNHSSQTQKLKNLSSAVK